jgi:LPS-assembly lipoprotein
MNKNAIPLSLIAILLLTTTACGWHLRGTAGNTVSFKRIHISAANLHSDLVRQLQRQLEASDVEVVESTTDAMYSLVIVKENSKRRTATVSASARVSERSLTEWAEFLVLNRQGGSVIPLTKVMVERVFEYDENNVLATNDEAQMLKREMRSELARQIYNRLRQLKNPDKAVDAPPG